MYCVSQDKRLRSQLRFLSLTPSITVVSEKDNLIKNNKNFKYDPTIALIEKYFSFEEIFGIK